MLAKPNVPPLPAASSSFAVLQSPTTKDATFAIPPAQSSATPELIGTFDDEARKINKNLQCKASCTFSLFLVCSPYVKLTSSLTITSVPTVITTVMDDSASESQSEPSSRKGSAASDVIRSKRTSGTDAPTPGVSKSIQQLSGVQTSTSFADNQFHIAFLC